MKNIRFYKRINNISQDYKRINNIFFASWSDGEPVGVDSYIKEAGHESGQVRLPFASLENVARSPLASLEK